MIDQTMSYKPYWLTKPRRLLTDAERVRKDEIEATDAAVADAQERARQYRARSGKLAHETMWPGGRTPFRKEFDAKKRTYRKLGKRGQMEVVGPRSVGEARFLWNLLRRSQKALQASHFMSSEQLRKTRGDIVMAKRRLGLLTV